MDVSRRVGGLNRDGKLYAIEVLSEIGDSTTAQALVPLLGDEDEVVRERAAEAVGDLGVASAIPFLKQLYIRMLAEHDELDFTGPVRVRYALTRLGARSAVVPPVTAALAQTRAGITRWPSASLATVITDLADHAQVVLYFMLWRVADDGHLYGVDHSGGSWSYDRQLDWHGNVAGAREHALEQAGRILVRPEIVALIEWIAESDLPPNYSSSSA